MKKGISPLIAVVLLIAATVAVAAILASWAKTYSVGQISQFEKKTEAFSCSAGVITFVKEIENPKIINNKIVAIIEVGNVPLGNFTFEVIYTDAEGIPKTTVLKDTTHTQLSPGSMGTLISERLDDYNITPESVQKVRIASNCSEVKSVWKTLK